MIVKHLLSTDAGELSPWLDSRTDLAKYAAGSRMLKNFIPLPQGGAMKRPGMEFRGTLPSGATTGRLIEFQTSSGSAAILALGGGKMRFLVAGAMLMTEDEVPVAYELDIPWSDDDLELVRWKQVNDWMFFVHPSHPVQHLKHFSDTHWELAEIDLGTNHPMLDENAVKDHTITATFGTTINAWATAHTYEIGDRVSSGGINYICLTKHLSLAAFATTVPAWSSASVSYLINHVVKYDNKVWRCKSAHTSSDGNKPQTGIGSKWDLLGSADPEYIWRKIFIDQSSVVGQSIVLTANRDTWNADHVGSVWELATLRGAAAYEATIAGLLATSGNYSDTIVIQGDWNFNTYGNWQGTFTICRSLDHGVTWEDYRSFTSTATAPRNVTIGGTEEDRCLMRIKWVATADGDTTKPYASLAAKETKITGLVRIDAFTNERQVTVTTLSAIENGTTPYWSEGAWSNYQGYPRCVEIHQGRLVVASTTLRPHTIWGSAVDDYLNFDQGTKADESWNHTIVIGERDPILWLTSESFLLVGSGSAEFIVHGESKDAPITAEFATARRQSSMGSHNGGANGIFADSIALFVQRGGCKVREFGYLLEKDRYESPDLTILSDHIFGGEPVDDVAIMRNPFQVVWFVAGGNLYGLTYERAQNVVAWHRHETQGDILSVACVRSSTDEDQVWFLVDRGGDLQVEVFHSGALTEPADDGWWCDASVKLEAPYDLAGAAHLQGKLVYGSSGGNFYGPMLLDGEDWPFVTGMLMTGFPNIELNGVSFNPNGRYEVAGERNGRPWYSLSNWADKEQFRIQYVIDGNAPRWVVYRNYAEAYFQLGSNDRPDIDRDWTVNTTDGFYGLITSLSEHPDDMPLVLIGSGGDADGINGTYQPTGDGVWTKQAYINDQGNTIPEWTIRKNTELNRWEAGPIALALLRADAEASTPTDVVLWKHALTGAPTASKVEAESAPADTSVVMGLRYDAVWFPMKIEAQMQNGSSRSRELKISRIVPSLYRSRSGKFGTTPTGEFMPLNAGSAAALFTGEIEKSLDAGYSEDGNVCILSDEPVPFSIRSLAIKFDSYGDN